MELFDRDLKSELCSEGVKTLLQFKFEFKILVESIDSFVNEYVPEMKGRKLTACLAFLSGEAWSILRIWAILVVRLVPVRERAVSGMRYLWERIRPQNLLNLKPGRSYKWYFVSCCWMPWLHNAAEWCFQLGYSQSQNVDHSKVHSWQYKQELNERTVTGKSKIRVIRHRIVIVDRNWPLVFLKQMNHTEPFIDQSVPAFIRIDWLYTEGVWLNIIDTRKDNRRKTCINIIKNWLLADNFRQPTLIRNQSNQIWEAAFRKKTAGYFYIWI